MWDKKTIINYNYYCHYFNFPKERIDNLIKFSYLKNNFKILDLAAGTGILANRIKTYKLDIDFLEPNKEMIKYIKNYKNKSSGYFIKKIDNFTNINSYDRIICCAGYKSFMDSKKAMKNINNSLKKQGLFIFDFYSNTVGKNSNQIVFLDNIINKLNNQQNINSYILKQDIIDRLSEFFELQDLKEIKNKRTIKDLMFYNTKINKFSKNLNKTKELSFFNEIKNFKWTTNSYIFIFKHKNL